MIGRESPFYILHGIMFTEYYSTVGIQKGVQIRFSFRDGQIREKPNDILKKNNHAVSRFVNDTVISKQ